jgi:hypothetical protein
MGPFSWVDDRHPERAAQYFAERAGLAASPVPVRLPAVGIAMLRHASCEQDLAQRWQVALTWTPASGAPQARIVARLVALTWMPAAGVRLVRIVARLALVAGLRADAARTAGSQGAPGVEQVPGAGSRERHPGW